MISCDWSSDVCSSDLDVLLAKSLLLLHGLHICRNRMVGNLLVEVDSESLVRLINCSVISKWPLCNVLRRIRALLWDLSSSATHIFREANTSLNKLAALRSSLDLFCTSLQQLPGGVKAAIWLDSREFSFLHCRLYRSSTPTVWFR